MQILQVETPILETPILEEQEIMDRCQ